MLLLLSIAHNRPKKAKEIFVIFMTPEDTSIPRANSRMKQGLGQDGGAACWRSTHDREGRSQKERRQQGKQTYLKI